MKIRFGHLQSPTIIPSHRGIVFNTFMEVIKKGFNAKQWGWNCVKLLLTKRCLSKICYRSSFW